MIMVDNVCAGYDGNEILHGISFELKENQSLSIIGPNGCGKTTLLRCIAGTLPFSGKILLEGKEIKSIKKKTLAKKVAMLSQITHMYFNYTVLETVLMGRFVHQDDGIFAGISKTDKEMALSALKTVGMLDNQDQEVDTLSGGQLQRVFLAKILAQDPDIILLDEPTNHLDLSYQIELVYFLKEWSKRKGKMVIGVLHDINLAMMLSDNVLLMDSGNIKAYGKCNDVYTSEALAQAYKMDVAKYMLESFSKWNDIMNSKDKLNG